MSHKLSVWVSRVVVFGLHAGCLLALWTGVSWTAALVCFVAYVVRGFGITGGYHRLFSHRAYETGPVFRSIMAILGVTAVQGGPLKWSREHRHHHKESDEPGDLHSPKQPSFFWAHIGWILSGEEMAVRANVKDLEKYSELVWIERLQVPILLCYVLGLYALGTFLGDAFGTSGMQMVVWGFFVSTVVTWHITWAVNSVNHTFGSRRFETTDDSRNNWLVGILALGEGHHNNHHAHPGLARQGLLWWEIDFTYYVLKALSCVGLVWNLNEPEPEVYTVARSLSRLRAVMRRRRLDAETIAERLKEGQSILASAVHSMARLRAQTAELLREKRIDASEMMSRLREGAERFAQCLRAAEALAHA